MSIKLKLDCDSSLVTLVKLYKFTYTIPFYFIFFSGKHMVRSNLESSMVLMGGVKRRKHKQYLLAAAAAAETNEKLPKFFKKI